MKSVAEFVSAGHPDRLCDAVVESMVSAVSDRDSEALVGIECAVHRNKLFIDGRIAAGRGVPAIDTVEIGEIARCAFRQAGYGNCWKPAPSDIDIITDLNCEALSEEERAIRFYSDDQNIVTGYAVNNPATAYLPVAHYAVNLLGRKIQQLRNEHADMLGPDFKLLAIIDSDGSNYRWDRLVSSCQHSAKVSSSKYLGLLRQLVARAADSCFSETGLNSLSAIAPDALYINGAGDFIVGGPLGDNGLSGKKLAIDFYGPEIQIGGGAICGKDSHKVDVCGAFAARKLALDLLIERNLPEVFTRLSWAPGEESPYLVEAFSTGSDGHTKLLGNLPPNDFFSINCINHRLHLASLDRRQMVLGGYMVTGGWQGGVSLGEL